ncbi:hypothetical protein SAMN04487965_2408 [Microbulbifer donghaiensis]|uniref:AhpC/TSA family protein n=1 Tax=Microbulbifer donghaiensis TaxID=494016 RepID=A0A1M5D5X5_9GAMM|nr:hypothetical protein [Microbulbifer donghaiensis]SHF62082.1 hypothetical protein SAMN04487965_2408 [Microbulbifer donghaiensis]
MNKFKVFFTVIAFVWLWSCGFWAIFQCLYTGNIAWIGLLINAWGLPLWMLLRFLSPYKYRGDQREPVAFAAVLAGLAVALLSDSEKGMPVYLAIYNLFIVLIYLFHLSALRHPDSPDVDSLFPPMKMVNGESWHSADACRRGDFEGLLLVFLRGSFCADSRAQLLDLAQLLPELERRQIGLVIFSTEPLGNWSHWTKDLPGVMFVQLASGSGENPVVVASGGSPLALCAHVSRAARPSQWLLDRDGFVLWRHLPGNYRTPGDIGLLRGQLFRLQD